MYTRYLISCCSTFLSLNGIFIGFEFQLQPRFNLVRFRFEAVQPFCTKIFLSSDWCLFLSGLQAVVMYLYLSILNVKLATSANEVR